MTMVSLPEDQRRRVRQAGLRAYRLEAGPSELLLRRDVPGMLEQNEQDLNDREHAVKAEVGCDNSRWVIPDDVRLCSAS